MSATNTLETNLLGLLFGNANCPNVGDATGLRGSSVPGVFYISLHTANPGEIGTQATTEATYGGYARQAVPRSAVGWSVAAGVVANVAAIAFPQAASGADTLTHFGIGSDPTGPGNLFLWGALQTPLAVAPPIAPTFAAASLTASLD